MFLSVFDIFKVGIGPSSSHTMGPMTAAARFLDDLRGGAEKIPGAGDLAAVRDATDRAVILGLCGFVPHDCATEAAEAALARVRADRQVTPPDLPPLAFDPDADVMFDYGPPLPGHTNGLVLTAFDTKGNPYHRQTYYSVGGGFVLTAAELAARADSDLHAEKAAHGYPYPFGSAREMLEMGAAAGRSIAAMKRANEAAHSPGIDLDARIDALWATMDGVIDRGLVATGTLPGGLNVRRRARAIHDQLKAEAGRNLAQPHVVNDWLSVYAMAVNEENAAGLPPSAG